MREPKEMGYCGKVLGRDLPAFTAWGVIEAFDSRADVEVSPGLHHPSINDRGQLVR